MLLVISLGHREKANLQEDLGLKWMCRGVVGKERRGEAERERENGLLDLLGCT